MARASGLRIGLRRLHGAAPRCAPRAAALRLYALFLLVRVAHAGAAITGLLHTGTFTGSPPQRPPRVGQPPRHLSARGNTRELVCCLCTLCRFRNSVIVGFATTRRTTRRVSFAAATQATRRRRSTDEPPRQQHHSSTDLAPQASSKMRRHGAGNRWVHRALHGQARRGQAQLHAHSLTDLASRRSASGFPTFPAFDQSIVDALRTQLDVETLAATFSRAHRLQAA